VAVTRAREVISSSLFIVGVWLVRIWGVTPMHAR